MNTSRFYANLIITVISIGFASASVCAKNITLKDALIKARQNDPWSQGNTLKRNALLARSQSATTLPDPKISLALLNVPVDSFNLNQENMTQLSVGISQQLSRGDTLNLSSDKLKIAAQKRNVYLEERHAQIELLIQNLWLDAYLATRTIAIINEDKKLLEQLLDVAQASYSSAVGNTNQQDVIQAEMELLQLDDNLTIQYQNLELAVININEWTNIRSHALDLHQIPDVTLPEGLTNLFKRATFSDRDIESLSYQLSHHPKVKSIDLDLLVSKKDVAIAKQNFKPQWSLSAAYNIRSDNPSGLERSNLASIGVTFDVPLFTKNRQDKIISATRSESESVKTDKLLMLRELAGQAQRQLQLLKRLTERQTLYDSKLIQYTHHQAENALTAYTNADGSFSDVVKARIAKLKTSLAALKIAVDIQRANAQLNYLFTQSKSQPTNQLRD